ncbi:MAG: 50S ribosomal protein L22 [Coriobacteriales bacterium]|nr:50S ribosomal protein L22 [Coriobacteriales bacterium]
MESKSTAKFVHMSPRKARIVINEIRGKEVPAALDILRFNTRGAADAVYKVVNSAASNALVKHGLRQDALYVKEAYADKGPVMKRYRPRAKGAASRIRKPLCHITIVVASKEEA